MCWRWSHNGIVNIWTSNPSHVSLFSCRFETVLSTEARFLASEVKPEGATSEPDDEVAEIFDHEDNIESIQKMAPDMLSKRMVDPDLRYKGSTNSGPIITNVSGSFPIYARNTPSNEVSDALF